MNLLLTAPNIRIYKNQGNPEEIRDIFKVETLIPDLQIHQTMTVSSASPAKKTMVRYPINEIKWDKKSIQVTMEVKSI